MKMRIKGLAFLVALALSINGLAHAETYKWTDSNGTVHFTDDPNGFPENQESVKKLKEEPANTYSPPPKEISAKDPSPTVPAVKTYYNDPQIQSKANWYCNQENKLRDDIDRAKIAYQIYKEETPAMWYSPTKAQFLYNAIPAARRALADFEEQARKGGVPPGWLECRFD